MAGGGGIGGGTCDTGEEVDATVFIKCVGGVGGGNVGGWVGYVGDLFLGSFDKVAACIVSLVVVIIIDDKAVWLLLKMFSTLNLDESCSVFALVFRVMLLNVSLLDDVVGMLFELLCDSLVGLIYSRKNQDKIKLIV